MGVFGDVHVTSGFSWRAAVICRSGEGGEMSLGGLTE